jgi:hypothetical protein
MLTITLRKKKLKKKDEAGTETVNAMQMLEEKEALPGGKKSLIHKASKHKSFPFKEFAIECLLLHNIK